MPVPRIAPVREVELSRASYDLVRWVLRRLPRQERLEFADRYPAAAVVLWAEAQRSLSVERIQQRWPVSRATAYRWLALLDPDRNYVRPPGSFFRRAAAMLELRAP